MPSLTTVDLVFGSPPYEDCRTYGIDFKLKGQAWVDWMVEATASATSCCKGLVAWVVAGKTRNYRWSGTPSLLEADLIRKGFNLRNPLAYVRNGIPGSGGPDWLRADHERIVCVTRGGRLSFADPTTMGKPTKYGVGGRMSNRNKDGLRINARLSSRRGYSLPKMANPGNLIYCGAVGGGNMGDRLCHENEAPFPEKLAEFMIRTFCPTGGTVLDPFCGSGTVLKVAAQLGRNAIGIDVRESQIDLSKRRVALVKESPDLFTNETGNVA